MFLDWNIPMLIIILGGPLAYVARVWYRKQDGRASKFADNGNYVRDDSLYSYDEATSRLSGEDKNGKSQNNS